LREEERIRKSLMLEDIIFLAIVFIVCVVANLESSGTGLLRLVSGEVVRLSVSGACVIREHGGWTRKKVK